MTIPRDSFIGLGLGTEARLSELGQQIAQEEDAWLEQHNAQTEVRERLMHLAVPTRAGALHMRALLVAGAALSMALALIAWAGLRAPRATSLPLTAHVGASEEPVALGRFVEAPAISPVALRFSDGSRIQIAERGRARLVGLAPNGADVSLESGLMHVKVQHREASSWHIVAGPFGVHVTGTRFDVRWSPEEDAFELKLIEGQVEVSGCMMGAGLRMQAGQTVRASCRTERYDVSSTTASTASTITTTSRGSAEASDGRVAYQAERSVTPVSAHGLTGASEPAPVVQALVPAAAIKPVPAASKPAAAEPKPVSWQTLARSGRYAQALRAARTLGFERECLRGDSEELTLLANIARYGQDSDGEAAALQVLRERFRGTKRAALAAFALGRLEFDNHGAYAEAAEWFRIYLREEPRGDLAREAAGRLLEATQRSGNESGARELAQRYLAEHPDGPHAELARRLGGAAL